MKAFVTSIGEKTEGVCVDQLIRLGYQTCVLGGKESWYHKYLKFIEEASKFDEPCLRVDADVIVNKEIRPEKVRQDLKDWESDIMFQYVVFDLYKNAPHTGQPLVYTPEVLEIIKRNLDKIDYKRPETSAWRLSEVNPLTATIDRIVGMHGFFQDLDTVNRAKEHKINRKQIGEFDFELVYRLMKL